MLRPTAPRCTGIVWHKYEPNKTIRANLRATHKRSRTNEELLRTYNVNPRNTLPKRRHYGPIWTIDPRELRNLDKLGEIAQKFPLSQEVKDDIAKLRDWAPKQHAKPAPPKKVSKRAERREAAIAAATAAASGPVSGKTAAKTAGDGKAAAKPAAKAAAKPEAKKDAGKKEGKK